MEVVRVMFFLGSDKGVRVRVKNIIIIIYLSSVTWLVERTQKPKCMGSNLGVDNRLVDLGREKI